MSITRFTRELTDPIAVTGPTAPGVPESSEAPDRQARPALIAFVVYLVLAVPLVLFGVGRYMWFFHDEWNFLSDRTMGNLDDLLRPHNEHLTATPIVIYRLLWHAFGVHSYVPYQAVVLGLHLGCAALLRVIMRRVGVGPWVATVAAGSFVLFGSGERNIVGAFQMTFTGALFFGLVHLVLADHDGPLDRRDGAGLAAGAFALTWSGVAPSLVLAVGLATLLRRGWRAAAFHVLPLAALYGIWLRTEGTVEGKSSGLGMVRIAEQIADFLAGVVVNTFEGIGYFVPVGIALGVVFVAGLVVAWKPLDRKELRRRAAAPFALLIGGIAFLAVTSYGRGPAGDQDASRYIHLCAAFLLPALAVAIDALVRRWPVVTPVMILLLLVGVPGNVHRFGRLDFFTEEFFDHQSQVWTGLAHSPRSPAPSAHPDFSQASTVTMGWLQDAAADGKVPEPGKFGPAIKDEIAIRRALVQSRGSAVAPECVESTEPVQVDVTAWEPFLIQGERVVIAHVPEPGANAARTVYFPRTYGEKFLPAEDDTLIITPYFPDDPIRVCHA
jgi:hypothetical protein